MQSSSTISFEAWIAHQPPGLTFLSKTQKRTKALHGKKFVCTAPKLSRIPTFLLDVQYISMVTIKLEFNGTTAFLFLDRMGNGYVDSELKL